MELSFLANARKSRDLAESAHAVFALGGWEWHVLKSWQANQSKPYARWFCAVSSPHTFGGFDLGDTYVFNVLVAGKAELVEVDGQPPTPDQLAEVERLRAVVPRPELF